MSSDLRVYSVPLKNVVTFINGDRSTNYPKADDYTSGGIPFISAADLCDGRVQHDTVKRITAAAFERLRSGKILVKDVLFCLRGSIGKLARVGEDEVGAIASSLVILRANNAVDPDYLYYWLGSNNAQQSALSLNNGSAQPNLSVGQLQAVQIPLPDIETQRSIALVLKVLDDRITLLRETNATLEAIAQALFKSWFVDFDPVRAKAEGRQPEGMDATTAALFPDSFEETELGLVPKGWRYVSLKDAVAIFDSQRVPLSGQERDKRKGSFPYYGAAALMDWVDGYLFDGIYLLTGEDGSVADAAGYPITQYVWGKIWVNNHAHVLQGKSPVTTEHLMLALQQTIITPFITGAVQAKLSQSNMWRIPFLMASIPVIAAFGEAIAPLFKGVRHNHEQAQTLTQLRDTLLPRLISGQLRLPDAEQAVEEALA